MSLSDELQRMYEDGRAKRSLDETNVMDRAVKELAAAGQAERATNVGDIAADFSLPNALGEIVALNDLLRDGPVVLSFYRGNWCPYCNLELRSLQANIREFEARGARLVAISPQVPDESLSLIEKHDLSFDVLSDVGAIVARDYGLSFEIPAELAAIYERRGQDLGRTNGGHDRTLVIPASYVVGQDRVVAWGFVNSDHTKRAEPADMIAALDALQR